MQWRTLFQKEMLEHWRNKKWIWFPLVMILAANLDPISFYFLPEIIESVGNVPEGMVFDVPTLEPVEAFMMSIEALSTYGVVLIALIMMNTIVGERRLGIAEMILAKPVKFHHYLSTKWLGFVCMSIVALLLSLGMSWYYIEFLYGSIGVYQVFVTMMFYSLWFIFVVTLCIFYHTICKNVGLVLACTIGTLALMAGINSVIGHVVTWFPNNLSVHLQSFLLTEELSPELLGTASIILLLSLVLFLLAINIFQRREIV